MMMKIFNWLLFATMLLIAFKVSAQQKVTNPTLQTLGGEAVTLPEFGKKHLLIFYVDPDRHKQNEAFTYELEENHRAQSPKIEAFGVINFKDTPLPNFIVRGFAKNRTEKNGALVLADYDNTLVKEWNLGDCNNLFVLIFVTNEGEIAFLRKGELSEQDKAAFYEVIDRYK